MNAGALTAKIRAAAGSHPLFAHRAELDRALLRLRLCRPRPCLRSPRRPAHARRLAIRSFPSVRNEWRVRCGHCATVRPHAIRSWRDWTRRLRRLLLRQSALRQNRRLNASHRIFSSITGNKPFYTAQRDQAGRRTTCPANAVVRSPTLIQLRLLRGARFTL